jgi:cytoskeleton protein RodZ
MSSSETENVAAGSTGGLLGEARQTQGLSVADVARQLKLSVSQVEALESGDFEKLPGPVFARGFIRNYARLLKLDPDELVLSVGKRLPREEPRPAAPPSHDIPFPSVAPRRWPAYAAAIAVVIALLALYEFYFSESQTAGTGSVAVPVPAPSAPASPSHTSDSPVTQPLAGQAKPPPAPSTGAVSGSAPPAGPPAIVPDAGAVPSRIAVQDHGKLPRRGEREVRMVFDKESWVEIRDRSGKAIFSQLNRRGTEQRVNGRPPLSLIVGNSDGVRLTYDDQPVDLAPYTKIDVARFNLE